MTLQEFCIKVHKLPLKIPQKALAVLWYHDSKQPDVRMGSGELSLIIYKNGLGNPNSTQLRDAIKRTKLVIPHKDGFAIKPTARATIEEWLKPLTGPRPPKIDHDTGYIPSHVWMDTRGYIEVVAGQINGCYQSNFNDGASVLLRRLTETLLIECYEHLGRATEIKNHENNFKMLGDIVEHAVSTQGISIGRDTKKALVDIKMIGDRAAHNRRYTTGKGDLDKLQSGVRVAVDELIQLAQLKRRVGGQSAGMKDEVHHEKH